jgi:hypothetical protein
MPCNQWTDESGPDGYTVFLREYFGNFEGELVQTVITVSVESWCRVFEEVKVNTEVSKVNHS